MPFVPLFCHSISSPVNLYLLPNENCAMLLHDDSRTSRDVRNGCMASSAEEKVVQDKKASQKTKAKGAKKGRRCRCGEKQDVGLSGCLAVLRSELREVLRPLVHPVGRTERERESGQRPWQSSEVETKATHSKPTGAFSQALRMPPCEPGVGAAASPPKPICPNGEAVSPTGENVGNEAVAKKALGPAASGAGATLVELAASDAGGQSLGD